MDLRTITRTSPYADLYDALLAINGEAIRTHPSPRYEQLHCMLDILLDYMGFPEPEDA